MKPIEIRTQRLSSSVAVLFSSGANVGVSFGPDGVYLFDSSFANAIDAVIEATRAFDSGAVRCVVTTHWHHDHAGGNEELARRGSLVIAHENTYQRMSTEQFLKPLQLVIPPAPPLALPRLTFSRSMSLHINGDTIHLRHIANAHTDGDLLIKLERANILLANDFFVPEEDLPFVDISSGGNFNGFIRGVEAAIALCDENTRVIPGHGPVSARVDLIAFRDLLINMRSRVEAKIGLGASLDDIKSSGLFNEFYRGGLFTPEAFTEMIYESVTADSAAVAR
jgi:cyclase